MEMELRRITTPEDDYYIKLDDQMFWMSDREFDVFLEGLKSGSASEKFREGESIDVKVQTTEDGIELFVKQSYVDEWKAVISPHEYYDLIRSLEIESVV